MPGCVGHIASLAYMLCLGTAFSLTTINVGDFPALEAAAKTVGTQGADGFQVVLAPTLFKMARSVVFAPLPGVALTVVGSGQDATTLECDGGDGIAVVLSEGGSLQLSSLTLTACASALRVEVISANAGRASTVTVVDALFSGSSADHGAFSVQSNGTVVNLALSRVGFLQNSAPTQVSMQDGGMSVTSVHSLLANLTAGGSMVLSECTFNQNGVPAHEGTTQTSSAAVLCEGGAGTCSVRVTGCTFHDNVATLAAGLHVACMGPACNMTLEGTRFYNNDMTSALTQPGANPFGLYLAGSVVFFAQGQDSQSSVHFVTATGCTWDNERGGAGLRVHSGGVPVDAQLNGCTLSRIRTGAQNNPGVSTRGVRSLQVTDTHFRDLWATEGAYGGVLEVLNFPGPTAWAGAAEVRLDNSTFTNVGYELEDVTTSHSSCAALWVINTNVTLSNTTMNGVVGTIGGALRLLKAGITNTLTLTALNSWFENATSLVNSGGGLSVRGADVHIEGTTFVGCNCPGSVQCNGAGFACTECDRVSIVRSNFTANRADGMGAALWVSDTSHVLIDASYFEGNGAVMGAGAVYNTRSSINAINSSFATNYAGNGRTTGGAFYVFRGRLALGYCTFKGNSAGLGGAICLSTGGQLEIDFPWFADRNNYGDFYDTWPATGDVYYDINLVSPLPSTLFEANVAYSGGAIAGLDASLRVGIFSQAVDSWHASLNTTFRANRALTGGAITSMRNTGGFLVSYASFEANSALMDDPMVLAALNRSDMPAVANPAMALRSAVASTGCGAGNGGALCFTCTDNCNDELNLIMTSNLTANSAHYGGALYVAASPEQCANPDNCYKLYVTGLSGDTGEASFVGSEIVPGTECRVTGNTAQGGAGGAVYMEHKGILSVVCAEVDREVAAAIMPTDNVPGAQYAPCAGGLWAGNTATGGAFGPTLASTPTSFNLSVNNPNDLTAYTSSEPLPISVTLYDVLGQRHTPAVINSLEAAATVVTVNDTQAFGQRQARVGGHVGVSGVLDSFTQLAVFSVPGPRTLSFMADVTRPMRTLQPAQVSVVVRKCMLNEYSGNRGSVCDWCDAGYYNLYPAGSICTPCPDGATCVTSTMRNTPDNGLIVPDTGMYHSNMFSANLLDCIAPHACEYIGRAENLTQYQSALLVNTSAYDNEVYQAMMCAPGYMGPLCAVCAHGYGKLSETRCRKCMDNTHLNTLFYVLMAFVGIVPLMLTAKSALDHATEIINGVGGPKPRRRRSSVTGDMLASMKDGKGLVRAGGSGAVDMIARSSYEGPQSGGAAPAHLVVDQSGVPHHGPTRVLHRQITPTLTTHVPGSPLRPALPSPRAGGPTTPGRAYPVGPAAAPSPFGPGPLAGSGDLGHATHPAATTGSPVDDMGRDLDDDASQPSAGLDSARTSRSTPPKTGMEPVKPAQVFHLGQVDTKSGSMMRFGALPPTNNPARSYDDALAHSMGTRSLGGPGGVSMYSSRDSQNGGPPGRDSLTGGLEEEGEEQVPNPGPIFKILLSYLQVISIIRFVPLPVSAPDAYSNLLSAFNTLISAPDTEVMLECSMPYNLVPRQISVVIVYIAIPFLAWVLLTLVWMTARAVHPYFPRSRNSCACPACGAARAKQYRADARGSEGGAAAAAAEGGEGPLGAATTTGGTDAGSRRGAQTLLQVLPFSTALLIVCITTVFFYYENLVEHLLRIFDCDVVDMAAGAEPVALEAGLVLGKRWRHDYRLHCYKGHHGVLTWALGVPGLLLIAIACPVLSAWWLAVNDSRLKAASFRAKWGFLYEEYARHAYAWESVVMLRKLVLSVVLVFLSASDIKEGVQVLGAVAIISISLVLHVVVQPHSLRKLSRLETLSLVTTMITLYLSLYYTYNIDFPPSYVGVGVLLIGINALTIAIFMWFIVLEFLDSILYKLGLLDVQGDVDLTPQELAAELRPKLGVLAPLAARMVLLAHKTRDRGMRTMSMASTTVRRTFTRIQSRVLLRTPSGISRRMGGAGSGSLKLGESTRLSASGVIAEEGEEGDHHGRGGGTGTNSSGSPAAHAVESRVGRMSANGSGTQPLGKPPLPPPRDPCPTGL